MKGVFIMFTGVIRAQRWSKLLGVLLVLAMVLSIVGFVGANSAYAATTQVVVKYNGSTVDTVDTSEISSLASYGYRTYSTKNCQDTVKFYSTHGATLADILSYAGITSAQLANTSTIEITSTDGSVELDKDLLLDDSLYYYPNISSNSTAGAVEVPTIIAVEEKQAKEDYTGLSSSNDLRLFRGQASLSDQSNDDLRKYITTINLKP